MSTTRRLHFLRYRNTKYILTSYPLDSVFTDLNTDFTQFKYFSNNIRDYPWTCFEHFIGSCNGILCFADNYTGLVILWNPSIRKFKELPLFTKPTVYTCNIPDVQLTYGFGFGYDSSTDKYKVVVVFNYKVPYAIYGIPSYGCIRETDVKVHTLGTNTWRSISPYPFDGVPVPTVRSGKYVSGTINWLVSEDTEGWERPLFIVSFDVVNESYQKILPRIGGKDMCDLWSIGVLRDCLCVTSGDDVWIMKEYGNQESWTKLFTVPYMRKSYNPCASIMPIYISENGQVILRFLSDFEFIVSLYDSKSGTLKPTNLEGFPEVCVESLISLCSLC